jgi:hypothetical protein
LPSDRKPLFYSTAKGMDEPSLSLSKALCRRIAPNCRIFVETGTYLGGGVTVALRAGFRQIFTVEMSRDLYNVAAEKFAGNQRVNLYCGDSAACLSQILRSIDEQALVFLDAHHMLGDPRSEAIAGDGKTWTRTPVRGELLALKRAPFRQHVIAIDDIDLCGRVEMDFITIDEITALIQDIAPNYRIELLQSCRPDSLLLATPSAEPQERST